MRKTTLRIISIALLLACCLTLGGCGHKHEFGSWEITELPTCTENGSQSRTCTGKKCGEVETVSIPSTGHSDELWQFQTDPGCTEEGSIQYHCSRCGEVLDEELLPAVGHSPGMWSVVAEASCTEDGEKQQVCTVCGEVCNTEKISSTGHSGEWKTVREMNERQTGLEALTCTVCGEVVEKEIPIAISCTITDGVRKGFVSANVTMAEIKSGNIKVTNLTQYPLALSIPAGTYLIAGSSSNQNMLVTTSKSVDFKAGESQNIGVSTACMNIHRDIPNSSDKYSVGFTGNGTLQRLVELFAEKNPSYAVRQAAVWIVTDNASFDDTGILVSGHSRYISQSSYNEAKELVELARKG